MRKLFYSLLAVIMLGACSQHVIVNVVNPVIDADTPDPTVIKIGDFYYAAATSGDAEKVYPRFKSFDMAEWMPMGHVFEEWPEWTMGSFWAPEFFELNGKVLCYYTARQKSDSTSCIGVAVADGPESEFTDHGVLVRTTNEAIDSYVFNDNGQLYITWKAYGLESDHRPIELLAQRLTSDGLVLEGEPFTLLRDDERLGCEGQCIFKEGDYYYILYSIRDCCSPQSDYAVSVARSKKFEGPYEKYADNPILTGNADLIQSCGHGTMVKNNAGEMFYLCHAYYFGKYSEGRKAILQRIAIGEDLWPHFMGAESAEVKAQNEFQYHE